jgi:hypothetical protein
MDSAIDAGALKRSLTAYAWGPKVSGNKSFFSQKKPRQKAGFFVSHLIK